MTYNVGFKRFMFTIPVIIIALVIFILSSMQQPPIPDLGFNFQDKVLHLIAYFFLGISIIMAIIANLKNFTYNKLFLIIFLIGAIYGASDEIHQYFVPGRDCSIWDWVADCIGILLSFTFIKLIHNLLTNTINKKL